VAKSLGECGDLGDQQIAQLLQSVASTNQQLGTLVALLNAPSVQQICPTSGQASP